MLTSKEAAQYLGLSPNRVSVLCSEGKIKARKEQVQPNKSVKRQWVMEKDDLDAYLADVAPGLAVDYEGFDLTQRQRQVLSLREHKTLAQVGKILGMSRQAVHCVQKRALMKIEAQKGEQNEYSS